LYSCSAVSQYLLKMWGSFRANCIITQFFYIYTIPWPTDTALQEVRKSLKPKFTLKYILKQSFWYFELTNSLLMALIIIWNGYSQLIFPDKNWNRNQTLMSGIFLIISIDNLVACMLYETLFEEYVSTLHLMIKLHRILKGVISLIN